MSWSFILADSKTMTNIGQLDAASDIKITVGLNKPGNLSFIMPMEDKLSSHIAPIETCVKALQNGALRWSGPVWTTEDSLLDSKVQVNCVGWFELLNKRITKQDITEYIDFELGAIAFDLIDKTNTIEWSNGASVIITPGTREATLVANYNPLPKYTNIGNQIDSMSHIENGYDYEILADSRKLNIYQHKGSDHGVTFGYDWGPHNLSSVNIQTDGSQICNDMIATAQAGISAGQQTDEESMARYGAFQEQVSLGEVRIPPPEDFAIDSFDHTPSTFVTGFVAPLGGTWLVSPTGVDADDFINTGGSLLRWYTSDTDPRVIYLSDVDVSKVMVESMVQTDTPGINAALGIVGRYVDIDNFAFAYLLSSNGTVNFTKRVGGTDTILGSTAPGTIVAWTKYRLRMTIEENGDWKVWFAPYGLDVGTQVLEGNDSDLATGNTLETGSVGLRDHDLSGLAHNHFYDDFYANEIEGIAPTVYYAAAEVAVRANPRSIITMVPKARGIEEPTTVPRAFIDFDIGDTVYLTASHGRINLRMQKIRVFGFTLSIDDNGNEKIDSILTTYSN